MAAACWAVMVTGTVLSIGGAPCFTVFVARAVLSAPLRLILLLGTETSQKSVTLLKLLHFCDKADILTSSSPGFVCIAILPLMNSISWYDLLTRTGNRAEPKAHTLDRLKFG